MTMQNKSITIKDVARLAEVSISTVSHVFNETRFVAEETREIVQKAAKELGYVSSGAARSLRSKKYYRIALLVPNISTYFSVDIIETMDAVFRKQGYQLVLGYSFEDIEIEKQQVAFFNQQGIDGLIMFPAPGDHSYLKNQGQNYPIVFMDRKPEGVSGDFIGTQDFEGAYGAVSLMIKEGHRDIAIIRGLRGLSSTIDRYEGYKKALLDHGIEFNRSLVGDTNVLTGYPLYSVAIEITERLLETSRFSALYVCNNLMSLGALAALQRKKVRVPEEVALLGMGKYVWAEITNPPMSLMSPAMMDSGTKAAELILHRIKHGGDDYQDYRLPMEIIRRATF